MNYEKSLSLLKMDVHVHDHTLLAIRNISNKKALSGTVLVNMHDNSRHHNCPMQGRRNLLHLDKRTMIAFILSSHGTFAILKKKHMRLLHRRLSGEQVWFGDFRWREGGRLRQPENRIVPRTGLTNTSTQAPTYTHNHSHTPHKHV